jgi:hypothetical protein
MATTGKNGPSKPKARRKTTSASPQKRIRKTKATPVLEAQILDEAHFLDEGQILAETAAPPPAPAAAEPPKPVVALVHLSPPPIEISHRPVWLAIGAAVFVAIGALVAQRARPAAPSPQPPVAIAESAPPPLVSPPPSLAEQQRALGHQLFVEGRRKQALHAYERALSADVAVADKQLIDDLVMCYGRKDSQPDAAALIVRFRLRGATDGLEALRSRGSHGTRRGAYFTLQRLDELSQRDRRRG